ncbi:MAG TPA: zf-HC2 domain-containing protein [Rhodanobacteraceae bacterium]|nr:zf-HC2 domain-containing protein [Rhodanobacteraceae bacterium]
MSAMGSGDCARAWETMPWVLQGNGTQEQSEWLRCHVAHCESCSAEFAQQSRLRLALSLPSDVHVDANAGLERLLRRVDTEELQEQPVRARPRNWLAMAVAAVLLFQVVGIGALGVKWWLGDNPQYRTLSRTAAPAPTGAIRVVPAATMQLGDWDRLLDSLQLKVVGGPNDVGAYTVAPTHPGANTAQIVKQLRNVHGIRLAEPVDDRP